jgi:probable rRNA maturation factor
MIFLSSELNSNLDLTIIEKKSYKILTFLSLEDKDLSILFIDDKRIQELNLQFRGIDKVTDVLSFSQNEGVLNIILRK